MSVFYMIDTALDSKFTIDNIRFIVQKGLALGLIYLADEEDKKMFYGNRFLSIDEVVTKIATMTEEISNDGGPFLHVKFQDTAISMNIYEANYNHIGISFGSFWYRWNKDFSCGRHMYMVDFARYIRLMFEICEDMTFLKLGTFSDVTENVVYEEKNCITVLICMGFFQELYSGSAEGVNGSFRVLMRNGIQNNFIFFDEKMENQIEPSVQHCYDTLKAEFPVNLYAKVDDVPFKIEIKRNERAYDFVSIYPLEPYRMKKGYGSEEEKIDLAFYVKRLIEICENFAIYELKTFI